MTLREYFNFITVKKLKPREREERKRIGLGLKVKKLSFFFFPFSISANRQKTLIHKNQMSGSGSSPNLRHNDSSLSLRTTFRKSQDVRGVLGTTTIDSDSRKIAAGYVMDERVFADQQNQDNHEQDGLLSSEVIDMGTNSGDGNDDNWYYYNSRTKEDSWRKKLLRRCTVVK